MVARLRYLIYQVRSSFWFLPAFMLIAGLALSWLAVQVDLAAPDFMKRLFVEHHIFVGPTSGRAILTTIAGSMITVASLVFSMTLIVLTMASGQLGPRILTRFMRDRATQVSLGLFIGTFVYSLAVLLTVSEALKENFVPQFSVLLGVVLAIASFAWLIVYIHKVSVSIQADHVVALIGQELRTAIDKILKAVDEDQDQEKTSETVEPDLDPEEDEHQVVVAARSGYVQLIEYGDPLELASAANVQIRFLTRAGHYVVRGEPIAEVRPRDKTPDDADERVQRACVIDNQRTFAQDLEFAFIVLVEIGVRALSPGVNDFNTAISVVDRLSSSLAEAFRRGLPSASIADSAGTTRIYLQPITYNGLVDTAFNEIRQCSQSSLPVFIRLIESVTRLVPVARTRSQIEALEKHAGILKREAERIVCDDADKKDVGERLDLLQDALEGCRD